MSHLSTVQAGDTKVVSMKVGFSYGEYIPSVGGVGSKALYRNGNHQLEMNVYIDKQEYDGNVWSSVGLTTREVASVVVFHIDSKGNKNYSLPNGWSATAIRNNNFELGLFPGDSQVAGHTVNSQVAGHTVNSPSEAKVKQYLSSEGKVTGLVDLGVEITLDVGETDAKDKTYSTMNATLKQQIEVGSVPMYKSPVGKYTYDYHEMDHLYHGSKKVYEEGYIDVYTMEQGLKQVAYNVDISTTNNNKTLGFMSASVYQYGTKNGDSTGISISYVKTLDASDSKNLLSKDTNGDDKTHSINKTEYNITAHRLYSRYDGGWEDVRTVSVNIGYITIVDNYGNIQRYTMNSNNSSGNSGKCLLLDL